MHVGSAKLRRRWCSAPVINLSLWESSPAEIQQVQCISLRFPFLTKTGWKTRVLRFKGADTAPFFRLYMSLEINILSKKTGVCILLVM